MAKQETNFIVDEHDSLRVTGTANRSPAYDYVIIWLECERSSVALYLPMRYADMLGERIAEVVKQAKSAPLTYIRDLQLEDR